MKGEQSGGGCTKASFLVACIVVLVWIGLIPMPIRTGRETSRQLTCRANLKDLWQAVRAFESNRSRYPGFREGIDVAPLPGPNDERSWIFVLLPYLDNQDVYDQIRLAATPNREIKAGFDMLHCPSSPMPMNEGAAMNHYVANTGLIDGVAGSGPQGHAADSAANGVFHDRAARVSRDIPIVTMTLAYIASGDGASQTFLLSENADAYLWTGGPMGGSHGPSERWMGFAWNEADGRPGTVDFCRTMHQFAEPLAINDSFGMSLMTLDPNRSTQFMRPSSYHPDTENFAFCDGRVRAISQDINYGVYQALMTPRGADARYTRKVATDPPPELLPTAHAARRSLTESELDVAVE